MADIASSNKGQKPGLLGSLKEALAAASRDDTAHAGAKAVAAVAAAPVAEAMTPPPMPAAQPAEPAAKPLTAAEAAREARGVTSLPAGGADKHMEFDGTNTTRIVRGNPKTQPVAEADDEPARTQLVRGRQPLKRGQFVQDPVVGWLVIVGGPGLGAYRPVFEGNNTIGRATSNRIPLDFGDETISSEEQAYIRYDSADRAFLFVPNLSKTNVVVVNSKKPTSAVDLSAMDVIVMGRTQLVFMPFCGAEFDWSEITETKD